MPSVTELVMAQAENDATALRFEDQRWTYREYVQGCIARAHLLLDRRGPGPFHVGLLLDNVPEFPLLLGGAALAGAAVVGINPTRRGAQLERDIRHADCQFLITETCHQADLEGLNLPIAPERRFLIASPAWREALAKYEGRPAPQVAMDPMAPY